ncbi:hypothetical protein ACFY7C_19390 [Streptomyces sp. NPDC012769]|uniref:hypothetical protein n=1 Tax=Streptomyces sp. NPDC012769 TaxID=3364848 RepID=UPI00367E415C
MPYEVKITVAESALATEVDAVARNNLLLLVIESILEAYGLMTKDTVISGHIARYSNTEDAT